MLAGLGRRKVNDPQEICCSPGNRCGINEGKIDPRHCINSSSKTYFRCQWVRGRAIVWGFHSNPYLIYGDQVNYNIPNQQIGGGVLPNRYESGNQRSMVKKLLKDGFYCLTGGKGNPIDFKESGN